MPCEGCWYYGADICPIPDELHDPSQRRSEPLPDYDHYGSVANTLTLAVAHQLRLNRESGGEET